MHILNGTYTQARIVLRYKFLLNCGVQARIALQSASDRGAAGRIVLQKHLRLRL